MSAADYKLYNLIARRFLATLSGPATVEGTKVTLDVAGEPFVAKGDVLGVARVAGIMGAKRTSDLIPLCHILNLTKLNVDFTIKEEMSGIEAVCTARTTGKTGVEMEALTGATVALLTIYDMCKAVDKSMEIGNVYLERKSGGKSGDFHNPRHNGE